MIATTTEPIHTNWISEEIRAAAVHAAGATAADVCEQLAQMEVCDVDAPLVPYMAAAAAEMALVAGIAWRFSADDAPVALMRLIAKVAIKEPNAGGSHTERLLAQLVGRSLSL